MEIFYREKACHAGKKFRQNDFAPSEKFSCYAPDGQISWIVNFLPHMGQYL